MADPTNTFLFEVWRKSVFQGTAIDSEGNAVPTEVTAITLIPLNEGMTPGTVSGSFVINVDDASTFDLGAKYEAVFTKQVAAPPPPVV